MVPLDIASVCTGGAGHKRESRKHMSRGTRWSVPGGDEPAASRHHLHQALIGEYQHRLRCRWHRPGTQRCQRWRASRVPPRGVQPISHTWPVFITGRIGQRSPDVPRPGSDASRSPGRGIFHACRPGALTPAAARPVWAEGARGHCVASGDCRDCGLPAHARGELGQVVRGPGTCPGPAGQFLGTRPVAHVGR